MLRNIAVACLMIVLGAGCAKTEAPSKKTATFRMNINREPPTMDPRMGSEFVGSAMHFFLFEGLMRLDPSGSLTCSQAKSVEISDDRLTYTFHLKDTVWSNGQPVTAHDFEYSWKKILSPEFRAPNAPLLYAVKNAELAKKGLVSLDDVEIVAKDAKTLVVKLEKPTPYFLDLIAFCVCFPVSKEIDLKDPNWSYEAGPDFISNGPFILKSWKHNSEIILEKNPLYWEADKINLDQVQISMISDENTALQMFEHHDLDIIGLGLSPIPADAIAKYRKMGLLRTYDSPKTSIVVFNVNKFPFNNKNIRKAFSYAINRSEIAQNISQLGETVATNIIPPILKRYATKSLFKDNDIETAQVLFKKGCEELGIRENEFPELTYLYSTTEAEHKLAQGIQHQWAKALGIKVHLQSSDHKIFLDILGNRSYTVAQHFWVAQYDDQMNIFERFKYKSNAKNYPGWESDEFIRLLDKTAYASSNEERLATFEAAEALMIDEMPLTPILHGKTSFMINPNLTNTEFLPNGAFSYARLKFNENS
jgi:oligopeptide transport system substrate-binding protein